MRSTLIAAIFLVAASVVSLPAYARPGMAGPWSGSGHGSPMEHMDRMADFLDLSEEQQATVADIVGKSMQASAGDRERMGQLRSEMEALSKNFDAGRAQQLAEEMGQLGARMAYTQLETMSRVRAVLTAQQQEDMDKLRERREQRVEKRREHMR